MICRLELRQRIATTERVARERTAHHRSGPTRRVRVGRRADVDDAFAEQVCDGCNGVRGQPNFGVTKALPYDDAYFISLHLLASPEHDQFFNGRYVKPENFVAGITSIYDLRCNPIADHRDPFHFSSVYFPRNALDPPTSEAAAPRLCELLFTP